MHVAGKLDQQIGVGLLDNLEIESGPDQVPWVSWSELIQFDKNPAVIYQVTSNDDKLLVGVESYDFCHRSCFGTISWINDSFQTIRQDSKISS